VVSVIHKRRRPRSAVGQGAGSSIGGEVTAVFADASGVWLEVLHGEQVRVTTRMATSTKTEQPPGCRSIWGEVHRALAQSARHDRSCSSTRAAAS